MTDFAYSCFDEGQNKRIMLPKSPPWNAPEVNRTASLTCSDALKADIFSLGLLLIWVILGLGPGDAHVAKPGSSKTFQEIYIEQIQERCSKVSNDQVRDIVRGICSLGLWNDPKERPADLSNIIKVLAGNRSR
jgi:hypothetical protein